VARDEPQPRLPHARSDVVQPCNLIDRRDDHVVVDQLLDAVHGRLPPLPIQLTRLLPEEPVNVRVASVRVDAPPTRSCSIRVAALPNRLLPPWIRFLYFFSAT